MTILLASLIEKAVSELGNCLAGDDVELEAGLQVFIK
jgi:hypothetical protein